MRISDWSSDVCSSDLPLLFTQAPILPVRGPMWWLLGAVRRGVDLVFAHKRPKRAAMFLRSPGRHGYVARMPAKRRRNISPLKTLDNLAFGRLARFSGWGRTASGGRGDRLAADAG